jgi:hypothetical protein
VQQQRYRSNIWLLRRQQLRYSKPHNSSTILTTIQHSQQLLLLHLCPSSSSNCC